VSKFCHFGPDGLKKGLEKCERRDAKDAVRLKGIYTIFLEIADCDIRFFLWHVEINLSRLSPAHAIR
jgi:hypothetical protein